MPQDRNGNWYDYGTGHPNERKKKTGAKTGVTQKVNTHKGGKIWVSAWNYSKDRGMITANAVENKKSVRSKSKNGNQFVMLMFEIFYKRTGATILELANFNVTTGKVYLKKMDMVISCKANNGGYFGQMKR